MLLGWGMKRYGFARQREDLGVNTRLKLLVFLIGGNVVLLLLHLLGGDYCLLINFTLGHLPTGFALQLLVILSLLLGALARACVNAGLVAVALPRSSTYGGTGIGDACPDAGLLSLQ